MTTTKPTRRRHRRTRRASSPAGIGATGTYRWPITLPHTLDGLPMLGAIIAQSFRSNA